MGKADAGTKEFWRDNERFADLFNAVIFNGESIIHPEDLTEMDTEASMALKTEKAYIQGRYFGLCPEFTREKSKNWKALWCEKRRQNSSAQ